MLAVVQVDVLWAVASRVATNVVSDVAVERRGSGLVVGLRGAKRRGLGRLGRVCRRLDGAVCRSRALPTNFVVTGRCDMVAKRWGSGLKMGGCEGCRGGLGRPGRECRRFRGAGGWFEAGDGAVVAAVNVVGVVDGGCVGVINGDVAALGGVLGCSTRLCVAVSVVWGVAWALELMVEIVVVWVLAFSRGRGCSSLACTAILQVFGSSVDIPTSFVRCGGSSLGDSVCRAAH